MWASFVYVGVFFYFFLHKSSVIHFFKETLTETVHQYLEEGLRPCLPFIRESITTFMRSLTSFCPSTLHNSSTSSLYFHLIIDLFSWDGVSPAYLSYPLQFFSLPQLQSKLCEFNLVMTIVQSHSKFENYFFNPKHLLFLIHFNT